MNYGFDNLIIDYSNSKYYVDELNDLILIKSFSERLVGHATNWSFYQIIDEKDRVMYEFYLYNDIND